jgi:hypothetical protein
MFGLLLNIVCFMRYYHLSLLKITGGIFGFIEDTGRVFGK